MFRPTVAASLFFVAVTALVGCGESSDGPSDLAASTVPADVEPQDLCDLPTDDIVVSATELGIEYVSTPDACFESLINYPYTPQYQEIDGLRMHYIDEGPRDGEVVLMLHGQPSWSYLYRKMIPVFVEAGYRVIASDHIGMGRSDKPVDPRVHTYDQQVTWNKAFIEQLALDNITLFVQDWGSIIGLRIAGEMPDLFARIVIANGDLPAIPPGVNPFTLPIFEFDDSLPGAEEFFANRSSDLIQGFQEWIEYAASSSNLFAAAVLQFATVIDIPEEELRAYDAPFPDPLYWGAIRAFPSMISGVQGQTLPAIQALARFDRPFLALAGEFDPNLGSEETQNTWIARVPGARGQDHRRYPAGHFIQEDVGQEMAEQVVDFMQTNPIPVSGPMFNQRYCELLFVRQASSAIEARVYASLGLNDCPQPQWDAIDIEAVTAEQGALFTIRNGPRYWVLDQITSLNNEDTTPIEGFGEVTMFGELDMRLVATVELSPADLGGSSPYQVREVSRSTEFTFSVGRRVFELVDPDGVVYMMQSMSQIINPDLQLHDLIYLDDVLELPPGWTYRTRILQEGLKLVANGIARVTTDDLSNTYQMVE